MRRFVFLFLLLGLLVAGCEFGTNEDAEAPPTETVIEAPIPGDDPVIDQNQTQDSLDRPNGIDAHEDAKDETPPGVTPAEAKEVLEPVSGVGEPKPLGGAELLTCPFQPVQNFSSRAGATVSEVVLHFTVSAPGSLDAIQNLFNTPSFAASSHIGLELNGRCEQWVKYGDKAWTQGSFNPVSVSVEIIARGTESKETWLNSAIIKQGLLASWVADRLKQFGLPPTRVNPEACTPIAGWTDHNALECGNTHTDVQPNFPYGVFRDQVKRFYTLGATRTIWRASSGGKILVNRPTYKKALRWMREHPVIVQDAEKKNGEVIVRKLRVPL